jgi:isocitrate dehydrogenase
MGWREAADLVQKGYARTLEQKIVTYDFARLLTGATEVKTSAFATAIINNMDR